MSGSERPGFAIWFTGLPAAGKTTIAQTVQQQLAALGIRAQLLDSDAVRARLIPEPTYSAAEREGFYDLLVYLAQLLTQNGVNVLIAATGHKRAYRHAARSTLARFAEVYVECPPAICRQRDPKGLWMKADRGEIKGLPGAGELYEEPVSPEVQVRSDHLSADKAASEVVWTLTARDFL